MASGRTKPFPSRLKRKPTGKLIRFDFPPGATPKEIAKAIAALKREHCATAAKPSRIVQGHATGGVILTRGGPIPPSEIARRKRGK